jgi:hypothetical protein
MRQCFVPAPVDVLTLPPVGATQLAVTTNTDASTTGVIVPSPAAESPKDSSALLIGGTVGGAVAVLFAGALVAVFVVRCRRKRTGQQDEKAADQNAHGLQSQSRSPPPNNYIANRPSNPASNNYSEIRIVHSPDENVYTIGQLDPR